MGPRSLTLCGSPQAALAQAWRRCFLQLRTRCFTYGVRRCAVWVDCGVGDRNEFLLLIYKSFLEDLAEREGFEPPVRITAQQISSLPHSTTLPSLRVWSARGAEV